jgi:hypothetical protein
MVSSLQARSKRFAGERTSSERCPMGNLKKCENDHEIEFKEYEIGIFQEVKIILTIYSSFRLRLG